MKTHPLKKFNILAKKAYKYSKDNNLGWKWTDAQKWTSKNIFQSHKNDSLKKINSKEIDSEIEFLLKPAPVQEQKKVREICYNPFFIPSSDLEDFNWWMLPDEISKFDANLNMAIEIDGFINTGIVKKSQIGNLTDVREDLRKKYGKDGSDAMQLIYRILVRPDRKDDGKPCSYYVLVTNEGSAQDQASAKGEIVKFVSDENLPEAIRKKRELEQKRREEEKGKLTTKKAAKERQRPQQVEVKNTEPNKIQLETDRYNALNRTLEILRQDFKDGILSKKEYLARQKQILKKFENGGNI